MRAILLALLLTGCAEPYWKSGKDFEPATIMVFRVGSEKETGSFCGYDRPLGGCAVLLNERRQCLIYLSASANKCTLRHELRHCVGDIHSDVMLARKDCG